MQGTADVFLKKSLVMFLFYFLQLVCRVFQLIKVKGHWDLHLVMN